MSAELTRLGLNELQNRLQSGSLKSVDLAKACLAQTEALEPQVHSFIDWNQEQVLEAATEADKVLSEQGKKAPPLTGIPVGIKDLILVKDHPGRAASKILGAFKSPYTATCVANLQKAGGIPFGRLNMDEFAMGSSTENSAFGITRNPWDTDRVPGGSSGGSAAAVAARQVPVTLGTDTGGSIRQPASFCGVTGIKPTYGRVSRYGVIAFASSLDQVGPLGQSAEDCAMLLSAIAGQDPYDATTSPESVPDFASSLATDDRKFRIGIPSEFMAEGLDPAIRTIVEEAAAKLESQGHSLQTVSLPRSPYSVAVYYLLATAEASSNLARYDGVRYGHRTENAENLLEMYRKTRGEGFGLEVKRRIMLGTFALSSGYYDAYYGSAQKVRTLIRQDFDTAFDDVDLILSPTSPTLPFAIGSRMDDPLQMYLADIYTISANLAGLPAISFPGGFAENLPVGVQMMAPAFAEDRLFSAVHRYQQETDFHHKVPAIVEQGGAA